MKRLNGLVSARLFCRAAMLILVVQFFACDERLVDDSGALNPSTTLSARLAGAVPVVDSVEGILFVNSQVSKSSIVSYSSGARLGLGSVRRGASYYVTLRGTAAGGISRWWARSSPTIASQLTESASLQVVQGPHVPTGLYDSLTVPTSITLPHGALYTTDGTDPRTSATARSAESPIAVTAAGTIYAAVSQPAQAATGQPVLWSDLGRWTFVHRGATEVVSDPTFSVNAGVYESVQSISLGTTTSGASIYYTTNGEEPTTASTLFNGAAFQVGKTTTIKAIAVKSGMISSSVVSATYTISSSTSGATFTDTRDGQVYSKVTIGTQTWMAQNLNYAPASGSSWCFGGVPANCSVYGRLYDWSTVMGLAAAYNRNTWGGSLPRQGICPDGWHVPSDSEWGVLIATVEANALVGAGNAGVALKSGSVWRSGFEGLDRYGFGVLPSGYYAGGAFTGNGSAAYFWTSIEYMDYNIWYRGFVESDDGVLHSYDYIGGKTNGLPLRCVAN